MTPEQIFSIVNAAALAAWLMLVALPGRRWVAAMTATIVPAFFAAAYVAIVAVQFGHSPGGFSSLAAVSTLFGNRWLLLAGWMHYLAFDLFVGTWEVRDARGRGIPHLLVVPCLVLTFLFGPAGWLAYNALRVAYRRRSPA